jgi:hypothetical protein
MDLNKMAREVHAANAKWWVDLETGAPLVRNKDELLMLAISEVAEAMEGERKGLMDDKLPHRPMPEVEMADVFIRLLDFAGGFGIEMPGYDRFAPRHLSDNKGAALFFVCQRIQYIAMGTIAAGRYSGETICDAISAISAYCEKFGYDLLGAYHEKNAFNAVRADHQAEARKLANGKKW